MKKKFLSKIDEEDLIKDLDKKIKEAVIKYKISEKDLHNYIDKEINLELQREN
jgi:hypothetical protein